MKDFSASLDLTNHASRFFRGDSDMLRTITVGRYVSIQGTFVRSLPDGKIVVRVGNSVFQGLPVQKAA